MQQIPGDKEYILSQYDLVGQNSRYPENENEIVLVVDENQTLTDLIYAQMGFYNEREFLNIARTAIEKQKENPDPEVLAKYTYPEKFAIDDIIGKELKYYPHTQIWGNEKKEIHKKTSNFLVEDYYFPLFLDPEQNPHDLYFELSHTMNDSPLLALDGSITIDNSLTLDVTAYRDGDASLDSVNPFLGKWSIPFKYMGLELEIKVDYISDTEVNVLERTVIYDQKENTISGFMYPAEADTENWEGRNIRISGILKKKKDVQFGCLDRGVYYTKDMTRMMMKDAAEAAIVKDLENYIGSSQEKDKTYAAFVTYYYTSFKNGDHDLIYDVPGYAKALNTDFNSSLSSMISIMGTKNLDVDKAYLRSLSGIAAKLASENASIYVFDDVPQTISIYPKSFDHKKKITKYLEQWNKDGPYTLPSGTVLEKDDRQELTYSDTIEIIVNVINTLITAITIALVAFTSLSLVVSCFMITVITYISTMERVKEIGVIRSLGGRKKDVSRLFIAECLIIGFASGVFGILITYLLSFIFNLSIMSLGVGNIAALPIWTALIMIGVSIGLNVLSGLIPAMKASSQDPVVALRTE